MKLYRHYPVMCFIMLTLLVSLTTRAAMPSWSVWVIDGNAKAAQYNSFAFDRHDRPVIVYHEHDKKRLTNSILKSGAWYQRIVDANADDFLFPSVAFNDSGTGGVSYTKQLPKSKTSFGTSLVFSLLEKNEWRKPFKVHSSDTLYYHPVSSLAMDSKGRPGIASFDDHKNKARFSFTRNKQWHHVIAYKEQLSNSFNLTFDKNNNPAIAIGKSSPSGYTHYDGKNWKFHKLPVKSSGAWQISLKFDYKNRATLVYNEQATGKLQYAIHDNNKWVITTVTEGREAGLFVSHDFDENNYPGIAYFDNRDNSIHYAFHDGMVWQTEKVDDDLGEPWYTFGSPITLDFDSVGNPGISYFNNNKKQLRFAYKEIKHRKYQSEICNNKKDDDGDGLTDIADTDCLRGISINASLKELQPKRYQPSFIVYDQNGNPIQGIRFNLGDFTCAGSTDNQGELKCNIALIIPEQGLKWGASAGRAYIREGVLQPQRIRLSGLFKGTNKVAKIHSESEQYLFNSEITQDMFLRDDYYLWQMRNNKNEEKYGYLVVENGKIKNVRLAFPASLETTKHVRKPGWVGLLRETDKKYKIGVVIDADTPRTEDIHHLLNGNNHGVIVIDESTEYPRYITDHQKVLDIYRFWKIRYQYDDTVTPSRILKRKKIIQKAMSSFLNKYNQGKIINETYWNFYCKTYLCTTDEKAKKDTAQAVISAAAWEVGQSAFINGVSAAAIQSSSGMIFKEALKMHAKAFADGISLPEPSSLVLSLGGIAIGYGLEMGNFGTWRDAMKGNVNLALALAKEVHPPPKYIENINKPGYGDVYLSMLEAARRHYKFAHKLYSFYKKHPAEKVPLFISPDTDQLINTAQSNIEKVESWIKEYEEQYIKKPAIDTAYGLVWTKLLQDKNDRTKRTHLAWTNPGLWKFTPSSWNKLNYKRYHSSGKRSTDYSAIAGGKDPQGCNTTHMGIIPKNFKTSNVQVVTFPLLDSLENMVGSKYKDKIRHGSTALKLKIGDREVTALSAKMPPGLTGIEGPAWYVSFEFDPAIRVSPGDKWYLRDGDNDPDTAVVMHSNNQDHTGLLGFSETSGCTKAFARRTGYSAWFGMK